MYSKFDSAPCKDCKDRRAGCHSECKEYKAYEARRNAFYEEMEKVRVATDTSYTLKQYQAVIKKPSKRGF